MRVPTILPFLMWMMDEVRKFSFCSLFCCRVVVNTDLETRFDQNGFWTGLRKSCRQNAQDEGARKKKGRSERKKKEREGTRRIFHSDLLAKVPRRQTNGIVDRWVFGPWYRCLSQTNASRLGWAAFHLARSWVEMSASCNKNDFFLWGVCVGWVGRNGGSKEEHRNFLQ